MTIRTPALEIGATVALIYIPTTTIKVSAASGRPSSQLPQHRSDTVFMAVKTGWGEDIEATACIICGTAQLQVISIYHKQTFSHPVVRRGIENLQ